MQYTYLHVVAIAIKTFVPAMFENTDSPAVRASNLYNTNAKFKVLFISINNNMLMLVKFNILQNISMNIA